MSNENVNDLYQFIPQGTKVTIVFKTRPFETYGVILVPMSIRFKQHERSWVIFITSIIENLKKTQSSNKVSKRREALPSRHST